MFGTNGKIDDNPWRDIKKGCNCCDNFMINCKPNIERFNKLIFEQKFLSLYSFVNGGEIFWIDVVDFFSRVTFLKWEKNDSKIIEFVEEEELNFNCYKQLAWYYVYDKYIYDFAHIIKEQGFSIEDMMLDYLYWSFGDPREPGNYFYDKFESKAEKYYRSEKKIRVFQEKFRSKLLKKYKKCQVCELENENMLVASHSKRYCECNSYESHDVYNGFLLCKSHDGLYDSGLITFTDEGNIIISDELSHHDREILNINENIKIDLEEESLKYLKWHRENWFKK